jgi:hypothetical protein
MCFRHKKTREVVACGLWWLFRAVTQRLPCNQKTVNTYRLDELTGKYLLT